MSSRPRKAPQKSIAVDVFLFFFASDAGRREMGIIAAQYETGIQVHVWRNRCQRAAEVFNRPTQ